MGPSYQYNAVIKRWVDADTVDLNIDLGFCIHNYGRVRLSRIDAPERFTDEGKTAIVWVNDNYPVGTEIILVSYKDGADKYGRWLGDLFLPSDKEGDYSINDLLVDAGHAIYRKY